MVLQQSGVLSLSFHPQATPELGSQGVSRVCLLENADPQPPPTKGPLCSWDLGGLPYSSLLRKPTLRDSKGIFAYNSSGKNYRVSSDVV